MPNNAPAMRRAGAITSGGWQRLRPGATRARTPGAVALAGSDCFPLLTSQNVPEVLISTFYWGALGPALLNQSKIWEPFQNNTPGFLRIFSKTLRKYFTRCGAPMMYG